MSCNFHKPKTYRSAFGCCICKAKSSSSRFTDSKRYECEFERCFKIAEKRSGEICNACVLLVKRWRKLPANTTRDWHHVVDARLGPGTKSMNKYKSKYRRLSSRGRQTQLRPLRPKPEGGLSDDITVGDSDSSHSRSRSPTPSDEDSDEEATLARVKRRAAKLAKKQLYRNSSFIDRTYWRKEKVCCGSTVYMAPYGSVLVIDVRLIRPCKHMQARDQSTSSSTSTSPVFTTELSQSGLIAAH